jgi:hypothetical protein
VELGGKNATNLKSHLLGFHKGEFKIIDAKTLKKKPQSCKLLQKRTAKKVHGIGCPQTSVENTQRVEAFTDITNTGRPLSLVNRQAFQEFCKSTNGKFSLPAWCSL